MSCYLLSSRYFCERICMHHSANTYRHQTPRLTCSLPSNDLAKEQLLPTPLEEFSHEPTRFLMAVMATPEEMYLFKRQCRWSYWHDWGWSFRHWPLARRAWDLTGLLTIIVDKTMQETMTIPCLFSACCRQIFMITQCIKYVSSSRSRGCRITLMDTVRDGHISIRNQLKHRPGLGLLPHELLGAAQPR